MERLKRLLIVDDEEVNRELLEGLVESFGHESATARNGQDALARLNDEFDLVLLDAMMPVMDGFEVARRIRANAATAHIPIVMVTALTGKEDRLRAVEAGANDFVTKPIDRTELRVRITSLLKMKEAQDAIKLQQVELRRINEDLRKKNAQMEADLTLAREIQQAFLPQQYLSLPRRCGQSESALRFYHHYQATTELGGDFSDILILSDTTASIFICDVMGHGVRSALITAIMRGLIEELMPLATEPGQFLTELNRGLMQILQRTRTPLFASAFYLVADVTNGEMRYANAGHPSPLHLRRQAGVAEPLLLDEIGPALGVFDDATYRTHRSALMDRDAVLLFTDGLVEVQNDSGEEFGEERLLVTVRDRLALSPEQHFATLLAEVQQFAGTADFEDDVCLVGMEVVHASDAAT